MMLNDLSFCQKTAKNYCDHMNINVAKMFCLYTHTFLHLQLTLHVFNYVRVTV